jgi:hypothetical protein
MEDISCNEVGRTYQDIADSFPTIVDRNEQQGIADSFPTTVDRNEQHQRFHPHNKDRWSKQVSIQ